MRELGGKRWLQSDSLPKGVTHRIVTLGEQRRERSMVAGAVKEGFLGGESPGRGGETWPGIGEL